MIKARWGDERAKWLHALIRALAIETIALLSDQYLLRVYVWFHVTMIVIVGDNLRYSATSTPLPSASSDPEMLDAAAPERLAPA